MNAPKPHQQSHPYGVYFIIGVVLGTASTMVLTSLLRPLLIDTPTWVRLIVAVSPFIVGAAYGARTFTFGRHGALTLRSALRRALPF